MTHDAVRAVASGEPIRLDGLFAAIRAAKRRLDVVRPDCDGRDLRAALNGDAQALKPFLKQALGVGLGQHERVWIRALQRIHVHVADHVPAGATMLTPSTLNPASTKGAEP